jgi:hypothetical protein
VRKLSIGKGINEMPKTHRTILPERALASAG